MAPRTDTYGVRSSFDARRGRGPFAIASSLQSDRLSEALEDVYHEVQALVGGRPPTQAEIDDARRALIEGQTRQFETPSALVSRYAGVFIQGLPIDHYATFPERIAAISLDDVISAMHRQIQPSALTAVVVADAAHHAAHRPRTRATTIAPMLMRRVRVAVACADSATDVA